MLFNLENEDFYELKIASKDRSRVNVVFTLKDESLNDEFIAQAKAHNIIGIKGHKVLGGMRASIYNAMPVDGVKKLVEFMKKFETENK